eukprot:6471356-Amphidinium_carterae.1
MRSAPSSSTPPKISSPRDTMRAVAATSSSISHKFERAEMIVDDCGIMTRPDGYVATTPATSAPFARAVAAVPRLGNPNHNGDVRSAISPVMHPGGIRNGIPSGCTRNGIP